MGLGAGSHKWWEGLHRLNWGRESHKWCEGIHRLNWGGGES